MGNRKIRNEKVGLSSLSHFSFFIPHFSVLLISVRATIKTESLSTFQNETMKPLAILTFILSIILLIACNKNVVEDRDGLVHINLDRCTDNIYGDNSVNICFDSVIEDSRCPYNGVCIWEGIAVCKFALKKNNEVYPFRLSSFTMTGFGSKDTMLLGYKIEFIDLTPHPSLPPPNSNSTITAKLKVTKL
jgi:hypothetical protein